MIGRRLNFARQRRARGLRLLSRSRWPGALKPHLSPSFNRSHPAGLWSQYA